jgi:hypothetical protein
MSDKKPRPGSQHPEEWRQDLNPAPAAGQNAGATASHPEKDARTVYDYKDLHRSLSGLNDETLKQIPVTPFGARLRQGATYLDLSAAKPEEFAATGDMEAGRHHCYVAKADVDYDTWNTLLGAANAAGGPR